MTNPVHAAWLPAFANGWINAKIGRAQANIERLQADPAPYKDAFVGAIPTALFVLVPIFALMLKMRRTCSSAGCTWNTWWWRCTATPSLAWHCC